MHLFILASMRSSSMSLACLLCAMHSAWAVLTAVNTAERERPWQISDSREEDTDGQWDLMSCEDQG